MRIAVISGSPRRNANTETMMKYVYEYAKSKDAGNEITFVNLSEGEIECFAGFEAQYNEATKSAAKTIMEADVWLIGTPIYNSFFSSALKNLFEYVNYKKTAGKTAGMAIMAAGNIGFTDVQTMITQLMSYFGVITNPKAVYMTTSEVSRDIICDAGAQTRLKAMVDGTLSMASKLARD